MPHMIGGLGDRYVASRRAALGSLGRARASAAHAVGADVRLAAGPAGQAGRVASSQSGGQDAVEVSPSPHVLAAVDYQSLARDEASVAGEHERDRVRSVSGLAQAPQAGQPLPSRAVWPDSRGRTGLWSRR